MQFRKLFTVLFAALSTLGYFVIAEAQVIGTNYAGAWTGLGPEMGRGTGYFPNGRIPYGTGLTNINERETSGQGSQFTSDNNRQSDNSRYVTSPIISRASPNLNFPTGLNVFNLESSIGADLKPKFGNSENGGSFKSNEGTAANPGIFPIYNQNFGINRGIESRERMEILPMNTGFPSEVKVQDNFPARSRLRNSFMPEYGAMRDAGGVHTGRAYNFFPSIPHRMTTRPGVVESPDVMNTGLNKYTRPGFRGFSLPSQGFGNPRLNLRPGHREGAEQSANYNSDPLMKSNYPLMQSAASNNDRPGLVLLNSDNMDTKQAFDGDIGYKKAEINPVYPVSNEDSSLSDRSGTSEQLNESDITRSDGVINEADVIDTTTESNQALTTVAPNVTTDKIDMPTFIASTVDKFNTPSTLHYISSAVSSLISDKEIDLASLPSVIFALALQIRSAFPGLSTCEQVNQVFLEIIIALSHILKHSTVGDVNMDGIPETADLIIQAFGTANQ